MQPYFQLLKFTVYSLSVIILIAVLSIPELKGDSFDRDFKDFETQPKVRKVKKGSFEKFMTDAVTNLDMEYSFIAISYNDKVPTSSKEEEEYKDNDLSVFEEILSYETSVERKNHRFTTTGWFTLGTQQDTYLGYTDSFEEKERKRRNHEINELYWYWERGALNPTVGKKIFKNGIATNFSPVDRISPIDWNDPLSPRQLGIWAASVDISLSDIDFCIAYFPWFTPSKYPSLKSRWTPSSNTILKDKKASGASYNDGFDYKYIYPNPSDQYFTKLEFAKDFDIYISYFQGVSPYPVIKTEKQSDGTSIYYIEHINVTNTSLSFSTVYNFAEIHAEAIQQLNRNHEKDDEYISYIYGTMFMFENVIFTLDYTGESTTKEKPDNEYESSQEIRSRLYGLITSITYKFSNFFNIRAAFILNTKDHGEIHDITMNWEVTDNLVLNLKSQKFTGAEDSFFNDTWGHNDRIIFKVAYKFGG